MCMCVYIAMALPGYGKICTDMLVGRSRRHGVVAFAVTCTLLPSYLLPGPKPEHFTRAGSRVEKMMAGNISPVAMKHIPLYLPPRPSASQPPPHCLKLRHHRMAEDFLRQLLVPEAGLCPQGSGRYVHPHPPCACVCMYNMCACIHSCVSECLCMYTCIHAAKCLSG